MEPVEFTDKKKIKNHRDKTSQTTELCIPRQLYYVTENQRISEKWKSLVFLFTPLYGLPDYNQIFAMYIKKDINLYIVFIRYKIYTLLNAHFKEL